MVGSKRQRPPSYPFGGPSRRWQIRGRRTARHAKGDVIPIIEDISICPQVQAAPIWRARKWGRFEAGAPAPGSNLSATSRRRRENGAPLEPVPLRGFYPEYVTPPGSREAKAISISTGEGS